MAIESFPTREKYPKIAAGIATMALLLSGCGERVSGQDAQQSAAEQQSAATVSETISAEPVDPEDNEPAATNQESIYVDEGGSIVHIVQSDNTDYSKGAVIRSVNDLGDGKVEVVTGFCLDDNYYQHSFDIDKTTGSILYTDTWQDTGYPACSTHLGQTGIDSDYIRKNTTTEFTHDKPFLHPVFCMENISDKTGVQARDYTIYSLDEKVDLNIIVTTIGEVNGELEPIMGLSRGNSCGSDLVERQREINEELGLS